MGKLETAPRDQGARDPLPWHGHITILTVAPSYRRLGYARLLTSALERTCNQSQAWFVDLYVRASNRAAIEMYKKMGYTVYRRVLMYYRDDLGAADSDHEEAADRLGGEDALDMRKPLDRDKDRKYVRENGEEFTVSPEDVY